MLEFLKSPQALGLGIGLLQASGPSPRPVSFGQALGSGLALGQRFGQQAEEQELREKAFGLEERLANARLQQIQQQQGLAAARLGLQRQKLQAQEQARQNFLQGIQGIEGLTPQQQQIASLAVQLGQPGAAIKALQPSSPTTQVIVGQQQAPFKIPQGFMLADPANPKQGVIPIPGGPAARLSSEAAKTSSLAEEGLAASRGLRQLEKKGELGLINLGASATLPAFFQSETQQGIALNRAKMAEAIGRLNSGGAIQREEAQRFLNFIPKAGDKPATIKTKLKQFDTRFNRIISDIKGGKRQFNETAAGLGVPTENGSQQRVRRYNPNTGRIE